MASITINNLNASTKNIRTGNNVLPIYQGDDSTGDTYKITPSNLVAKTLDIPEEYLPNIKNIVTPSGNLSANKFLNQLGEWVTPIDTNTTYGLATSSANGLMTSAHYSTVQNLGAITLATSQLRGYMSAADKKKLDNLTTATATTGAPGYLPNLNGGNTVFLRGDGNWATPPGSTYADATSSSKGLMTAAQFKKLESIASSATRNVFSAIAGYPTGNQTPSFGGTFNIYQVGQTTAGAITHTTRTVTIPNNAVTTSANGLMTSTDKTRLDNLHAITDVTTSAHGYMIAADKIKVNKINNVWYYQNGPSSEIIFCRCGDLVIFYCYPSMQLYEGTYGSWSIPNGFKVNSAAPAFWGGLYNKDKTNQQIGDFRIAITDSGSKLKYQSHNLKFPGEYQQAECFGVWITSDSIPTNAATISKISI